MHPSKYKQRILITSCGLNPQILTETLYALLTKNIPFVPTEIHMITTTAGKEKAIKNIFYANSWYYKLLKQFQIENIHFTQDSIHIVHSPNKKLSDIRTVEDNEISADYITEFIRKQCHRDNASIHLSIAGGRKTMGFYLAYSLSLFGRNQDSLSHVLVKQKYESNELFYFPNTIDLINDKSIISLAEIPFLRMSNNQEKYIIEGKGYTQTIREFQNQIKSPVLIIDIKHKKIKANEYWIKLPISLFCFYIWVIDRFLNNNPIFSPSIEGFNSQYANEFLNVYKKLKGEVGDTDRTIQALKYGMSQQYVYSKVGDIRRKLIQLLGTIGSQNFIIKSEGKPCKYFVTINAENIRWSEEL